jgi:DNA-binding transcriptional regulator GbsR (MarR family)
MTPATDTAIYRSCEAIGSMVEVWGFKRVMGMVWGYLFLSDRPMSAQEIREGLGISAGLVSMVINDLERWGVVHKCTTPGERREYFEAEPDIWSPIAKVLRERELKQMEETLGELRSAREIVNREVPSRRLDDLIAAGELGHQLLEQFINLGVLDVRDVRSVGLGVGLTRTMFQLKKLGSRSENR